MPFLLRKIRKSRWYRTARPSWLAAGCLQADPLADLGTQENKLSLWHVDDSKSNLDEVIVALATNLEHTSDIGYALIDPQLLSKSGFQIQSSPGRTKHQTAGACWHYDVIELSARRLVELAKLVMEHGETGRYSENTVIRLLEQATRKRVINREDLEPDVAKKIP